MSDDLFSNYSRRNLVRKGTIEAIKEQQRLEGIFRQKRLEKEAGEVYVGEAYSFTFWDYLYGSLVLQLL